MIWIGGPWTLFWRNRKGLLIAQRIPSLLFRAKSWHLTHLTRVSNTSLTDTEPALQWILTSLLCAACSQRVLIHLVHLLWYCSQGNRSKTALRASSSAGFWESLKSTPRISTFTRRPWALGHEKPNVCGTITLSRQVPRSCRISTLKSYFVPKKWCEPQSSQQVVQCLWCRSTTVWANVSTQLLIPTGFCMTSGNWKQNSLIPASYKREILFFSKSRRNLFVGRTLNRKGSWYGWYRHICSVAHTCHGKKETVKLGGRHFGRQGNSLSPKGHRTCRDNIFKILTWNITL